MNRWAIVLGLAWLASLPGAPPARAQGRADTLDAINADFEKAYREIEKARIDRLAKFAAAQPRDQANVTYEALFRAAIGSGLYVEAEPVAKQLLKAKSYNAPVGWLAVFVAMLAEAKRGAYEDSLATLESVIHANQEAAVKEPENRLNVTIPEAQRISLIDAYYQILVQADKFDVAQKAMALIQQKTESSLIKKMVTNRIKQLGLVGKPAPAFKATDLDGKPVALADLKGKAVLLVFWTTWSLPSTEVIEWYETATTDLHKQGLQIIEVNVDAMEEGVNAQAVLPGVRKFALDRNLNWPIVVDQPGNASIAAAYGVSEIPSSVLIGKDGKVAHLDLRRSNLEAKVAEALGR